MILRISDVVSQFKKNWTDYLAHDSIKELCKELGLSWRERKLEPATTVELMLLQVLHANTAISYLPHLSKLRFSPAAFCKARLRLPLILFENLVEKIAATIEQNDLNQRKWLGHRVLIADGTGISMPEDRRLVEAFGYPRHRADGSGFPVARLLYLMHHGSGMISKVLINPFRSHEGKECYQFHSELTANDLFLGDRAFCSYAHIAALIRLGAHAVLRLHQKVTADFTPGRDYARPGKTPAFPAQTRSRQIQILGKKDQIVEWFRGSKLSWMSRQEHNALPTSLVLRELQYHVSEKGFRTSTITIVTTLLDNKKYPAKEIAALYFKRWSIETNINYLKTTMNMEVLKTKTADNIRKQILVFCIVYNLVRLVMLKAAGRQRVAPDRISFIDALRWLLVADQHSRLSTLIVVPYRPGRCRPRIKKRHDKGFQYRYKTEREKKDQWNELKDEWKQQISTLSK
jgi:hypothetical protein